MKYEAIKINNKNGIGLYYQVEKNKKEEIDRLLILDSNKEFFDDIYLEDSITNEDDEEIKKIIQALEQITIERLIEDSFYHYKIYNNLAELSQEQYDELLSEEEILNMEYTNKFIVNGKVYYAFLNE